MAPSGSPKALVRARVRVRGRVQGVGFRWFVSDLALAAGLSGWVRNLRDGGVECVVEGPRREVEQLISRLRDGPPWAVVSSLEVGWEEALRDLEGFQVRP